jgi:hypothetical protein
MAKAAEKKQAVGLPVMDNPSAPDFYADEAIGCFWANNTMRITLATARADHTRNPNEKGYVVTGRLVMPIAAAENLHRLLGRLIENMKKPPAKVRNIADRILQ